MISAIILTWNSEKYIKRCLDALGESIKNWGGEAEVFVVDNGSQDQTVKIIEESKKGFPSKIELVRLEKNLGTTVSRNRVLKKVTGDYILILDSDTEMRSDALRVLIEKMKEEKDIGILAPRLIYPDGSSQISCKRFPTAKTKLCKFLPLGFLRRWAVKDESYGEEVYKKTSNGSFDVDYCISACWLVRREAISDIGLLDERIFYSPEDVDYCLRMWLSGWRVAYCPVAEVVHHTQRVSYKSFGAFLSHLKGLAYYFMKHGYFLSRNKLYRRIQGIKKY